MKFFDKMLGMGMEYLNSTELNNAMATDDSTQILIEILANAWPEQTTAENNPRTLDEYLDLYKQRYEERTLMINEELSENAEKLFQCRDWKEQGRVCEKMLRDTIFEKILGEMMNRNIAPDSFIKIITRINLLAKMNVLKTSVNFTKIMNKQMGEKKNFQESMLWLLSEIKESEEITPEPRQIYIMETWGKFVESKDFLREIIKKNSICDVLEAMESNNMHPEFLVEALEYFSKEIPIENVETPLVPNTGMKSVRLETKFDDKNTNFITSTVKTDGKNVAENNTYFNTPIPFAFRSIPSASKWGIEKDQQDLWASLINRSYPTLQLDQTGIASPTGSSGQAGIQGQENRTGLEEQKDAAISQTAVINAPNTPKAATTAEMDPYSRILNSRTGINQRDPLTNR